MLLRFRRKSTCSASPSLEATESCELCCSTDFKEGVAELDEFPLPPVNGRRLLEASPPGPTDSMVNFSLLMLPLFVDMAAVMVLAP